MLAASSAGCKRKRPPVATDVWLGPAGGCIATEAHPTFGVLGCWGGNDAGQIGDGTTIPRSVVSPVNLERGALTGLALAARHSCAVFDGHAAYCWGDGDHGQLGASVASSAAPVSVGEGDAVGASGAHSCVRAGARLRCFGADDEGQLGHADDWTQGTIGAFALGEAHTCAAREGGPSGRDVICRGRAVAAPREPVLASLPVRALAAGRDHTCALVEDRSVRCWGKNDAGQLGDGTTIDSLTPATVLGLGGVTAITSGWAHTCALLENRTVVCWGDNRRHQLSNGTTERSTHPVLVVGLVGVRRIAAGGDGTCAVLGDGAVRCWGANERGQLGDGTTEEHTVPMPIGYRR